MTIRRDDIVGWRQWAFCDDTGEWVRVVLCPACRTAGAPVLGEDAITRQQLDPGEALFCDGCGRELARATARETAEVSA